MFDADTENVTGKRPKCSTYESRSEDETVRLGTRIGECIGRDGACVALVGPLGAGKTVLTRGLCLGLGVADPVTSPTFTLVERFAGRIPVVHADLYRLEHETELDELGVFDSIRSGVVVLVEWADRSPALMRQVDVVVTLEYAGESVRRVRVEGLDLGAGKAQA